MTVPKEIEIKLGLPATSLARLKKIPLLRALKAPPKRETQVSVYFDTDKHTLRKKGLMLRVRRVGSRYVQTIKATGNSGLFERDEWEGEIASEMPDLRLARGTALEPLLSDKFCRQLRPMFETRVRRTTYPIADGERDIALTLDKGEIATGRRSEPLCEIELELKRGNGTELFDLARELTSALPAQLAFKSKSERGYELLEDKGVAAAKGAPIDLSAGTSTREAFRTIGRACLKQIIGNEPALLAGDAEGVHQMRVGMRRLRAAMSLFADILRDPETTALEQELKWLAGELAPARELEVLVTRVVAPARRRHSRLAGVSSLSRDLAAQRAMALARAQDAVRSARFRALTLEIAAWLEAGQWTRPQDDLVRDRGEVPIEISAAEQLTRRFRKIRKQGKVLTQLDAGRRHKLRIQAKKVRYAAEFFANLFPGKKAARRRKRFLSALEGVQDGLGDLNDIAVHEDRITAIANDGGSRRRRGSPKRAFAAGLLSGREDARFETALANAADACTALARVKPFWG
ncbi:MAG TPA: CHAD domain-containing protein [Xanthobacteraceae bacterium]|jgi:inorganic triphosphatase YgiF